MYMHSWPQWFCHIDDDVYVNVEQLKKLLFHYDPSKPYYIGRHWRTELGLTVRHSFTKFYVCVYQLLMHMQPFIRMLSVSP